MKLPSITLAALALAGLAAFAPSANAQITTSTGDLIVAIYQTSSVGGNGFGTVYEADLGSLTNFSSSVTNLDLSGKVSITDLDTIFGGGAGNPDLATLSYEVLGTQGTGTLHINGIQPGTNSVLVTDSAVSAPANSTASSGSVSTGASRIGTLQNNMNSQTPYSANSSVATTFSENAPNTTGFGLNSTIHPLVPFANAGNFYLLNTSGTGTASLDGSFDFVGGTKFTFNPVAAPEPSTYALMGLGALLLIITARRRMASNS